MDFFMGLKISICAVFFASHQATRHLRPVLVVSNVLFFRFGLASPGTLTGGLSPGIVSPTSPTVSVSALFVQSKRSELVKQVYG